MTFSSKLQKLRKDNNLSQEDLARELNVSRQAVSKWELGTLPDINNLVRISQYFDCSLDFLINDSACSEDKNNIENNKTGKKEINIYPLLLISVLILSIMVLIGVNICSIINPAPIVRQANDGSWYVGIVGFIEYYNLRGLIFLLFMTMFLSFSLIIFYILGGKSKKEAMFEKQNRKILCGYLMMIAYGFLVFFKLMTASCFIMDISEILFAIIVNVLGILLIISGVQKKKGN